MSESEFSPMPPGYTTLRRAGEGCSGRVFLALRNPDVQSASNRSQQGDEDGAVEFAVSKIVAVKISTLNSDFSDERGILESIRRQPHLHASSNNIIQLFQADPQPKPQWMVLSTMPFSCDLHSAAGLGAPPIGLVWLVFQGIYHALDFLQNKCNPPIAHGDVNSTNILLGFHDPAAEILPKVMLIDFDRAKEEQSEIETRELYNVIGDLGVRCLEFHDGEGASYDALRNFVSGWDDIESVTPRLSEIWSEYGASAEQAVRSLSAPEEQEVHDTVLGQIVEVGGDDQESEDIRDVVRRMLK